METLMSLDDDRELIAYVRDGWKPMLEPAPRRRQWMDDTRDQFAYRCLPLAMANAHGWQFLAPRDVEVVWDGGDRQEAVKIYPLDTPVPGESELLPVSIFGHGILTFHIESVMRTPPGWNLWVTGAPNYFKDGIAPLSGLVETDWAPMSFTMNWKMTRPGHAIKFNKGDPICFFFPVRRGDVESFHPRRVAYEKVSAEYQRFIDWSKSRDTFIAGDGRDEKHPAWQKHYFQGVDIAGRHGAPDHQTKLKVRPFDCEKS